mmetsp:Transcript_27500/g.31373  ORF Transcript_27500/g.31373 Transcript_27500/m.31373 type:complete len:207 (-) Transcript_27500:283-903(-)
MSFNFLFVSAIIMQASTVSGFSHPNQAFCHIAETRTVSPYQKNTALFASSDADTPFNFDFGEFLKNIFGDDESASKTPAISTSEVKALFGLWNDALVALDPDAIAKRYASTTILLPTVSDLPRSDYEGIRTYFVEFCKRKPSGEILESTIIQGDDYCMDAGIYEFTMGTTGDKVKARYTFVYTYEEGEWKIAHHHSSVMPEALLAK